MILGADLMTLTPSTVSMLTNPDVIALDQDRLGLQPVRVTAEGATVEIWTKILSDSEDGHARRAILLLNRNCSDAQSTLPFERMGLVSESVSVREIGHPGSLSETGKSGVFSVAASEGRLLLAEGDRSLTGYFVPAVKADPAGKGAQSRVWLFPKSGGIRNSRGLGSLTRIWDANSRK
ncbi:hypothetical protein [Acidisarcina polymorpha]|uniref:hypothetical protein n=1 Tax=Acidisarcina polymorpha TaxID=2211140 RepID=UPI000DF006B9|nr:hypothetical protein [Acidisarcina polymorpha]